MKVPPVGPDGLDSLNGIALNQVDTDFQIIQRILSHRHEDRKYGSAIKIGDIWLSIPSRYIAIPNRLPNAKDPTQEIKWEEYDTLTKTESGKILLSELGFKDKVSKDPLEKFIDFQSSIQNNVRMSESVGRMTNLVVDNNKPPSKMFMLRFEGNSMSLQNNIRPIMAQFTLSPFLPVLNADLQRIINPHDENPELYLSLGLAHQTRTGGGVFKFGPSGPLKALQNLQNDSKAKFTEQKKRVIMAQFAKLAVDPNAVRLTSIDEILEYFEALAYWRAPFHIQLLDWTIKSLPNKRNSYGLDLMVRIVDPGPAYSGVPRYLRHENAVQRQMNLQDLLEKAQKGDNSMIGKINRMFSIKSEGMDDDLTLTRGEEMAKYNLYDRAFEKDLKLLASPTSAILTSPNLFITPEGHANYTAVLLIRDNKGPSTQALKANTGRSSLVSPGIELVNQRTFEKGLQSEGADRTRTLFTPDHNIIQPITISQDEGNYRQVSVSYFPSPGVSGVSHLKSDVFDLTNAAAVDSRNEFVPFATERQNIIDLSKSNTTPTSKTGPEAIDKSPRSDQKPPITASLKKEETLPSNPLANPAILFARNSNFVARRQTRTEQTQQPLLDKSKFKIMTWNFRLWFHSTDRAQLIFNNRPSDDFENFLLRRAAFASFISRENPDLVGIQEVGEGAAGLEELAEILNDPGIIKARRGENTRYSVAHAAPKNISDPEGSLGVGLLSKFPFIGRPERLFADNDPVVRSKISEFFPNATPESVRIKFRPILKVMIEKEKDNRILIYVCHFKSRRQSGNINSEKLRKLESIALMRDIMKHAQSNPTIPYIVMGDLNYDYYPRRPSTTDNLMGLKCNIVKTQGNNRTPRAMEHQFRVYPQSSWVVVDKGDAQKRDADFDHTLDTIITDDIRLMQALANNQITNLKFSSPKLFESHYRTTYIEQLGGKSGVDLINKFRNLIMFPATALSLRTGDNPIRRDYTFFSEQERKTGREYSVLDHILFSHHFFQADGRGVRFQEGRILKGRPTSARDLELIDKESGKTTYTIFPRNNFEYRGGNIVQRTSTDRPFTNAAAASDFSRTNFFTGVEHREEPSAIETELRQKGFRYRYSDHLPVSSTFSWYQRPDLPERVDISLMPGFRKVFFRTESAEGPQDQDRVRTPNVKGRSNVIEFMPWPKLMITDQALTKLRAPDHAFEKILTFSTRNIVDARSPDDTEFLESATVIDANVVILSAHFSNIYSNYVVSAYVESRSANIRGRAPKRSGTATTASIVRANSKVERTRSLHLRALRKLRPGLGYGSGVPDSLKNIATSFQLNKPSGGHIVTLVFSETSASQVDKIITNILGNVNIETARNQMAVIFMREFDKRHPASYYGGIGDDLKVSGELLPRGTKRKTNSDKSFLNPNEFVSYFIYDDDIKDRIPRINPAQDLSFNISACQPFRDYYLPLLQEFQDGIPDNWVYTFNLDAWENFQRTNNTQVEEEDTDFHFSRKLSNKFGQNIMLRIRESVATLAMLNQGGPEEQARYLGKIAERLLAGGSPRLLLIYQAEAARGRNMGIVRRQLEIGGRLGTTDFQNVLIIEVLMSILVRISHLLYMLDDKHEIRINKIIENRGSGGRFGITSRVWQGTVERTISYINDEVDNRAFQSMDIGAVRNLDLAKQRTRIQHFLEVEADYQKRVVGLSSKDQDGSHGTSRTVMKSTSGTTERQVSTVKFNYQRDLVGLFRSAREAITKQIANDYARPNAKTKIPWVKVKL